MPERLDCMTLMCPTRSLLFFKTDITVLLYNRRVTGSMAIRTSATGQLATECECECV